MGENQENASKIAEILQKFPQVHYAPGPIRRNTERIKAQNCLKTDELEAIYHLVESHVPSLRSRAVLRYEKNLTSKGKQQLSLSKNHLSPHCTNTSISENVHKMLESIKEMPSEWTLVQLTPHYNSNENLDIRKNKYYTNSLYITVFNCGQNQPKPFCVSIKAPKDISGSVVSLRQELFDIIKESTSTLSSMVGQSHFKGVSEKRNYQAKRAAIDERLKMLVKELQDLYLKEWRCFLMGKYVDSGLEVKVQKRLKELLEAEVPSLNLTEKTMCILQYLTKAACHIKLTEMKTALQALIPDDQSKDLVKIVGRLIRAVSNEFALTDQKTHPLILIMDDTVDCFPWEMMDILADRSVSRLPSLHFAYALFQEHKNTIKNGYKIINNPKNGTYIVNPDLDLKSMQNRILSFYEYWVPSWKGVAGCKPPEEKFEELLTTGDIFAYNGHGAGTHILSAFKIEKLHVNAVVLLFGCSSTKLQILGPQTEMFGSFQMYLIACSPCIIGNLWEVTDLDTDILATELLSQWIPNPEKTPWKNLDKTQWKKGEKVQFSSEDAPNRQTCDSELLRVLSAIKNSNLLSFYLTKASIVARGIPVKIHT